MPAIDPSEHTIPELEDALESVDDPAELEAILEAERAGKDRVGGRAAIESRLAAVEESEGDDVAAGDDGGGADPAGGGDDVAEPPLDPGEYDISELGPAIQEIEDVAALEAILAAEEAGEARAGAIALIESRVEKFADDGEEEPADPDAIDPGEHSPAELGNLVREIDEIDPLEGLLEREEAGQDRSSVKTVVQNRIDSLRGSDGEDGDGEPVEVQSPEERHPELDHPTADKRHVRALEDGTYGDMWVYCETQAGELLDVSKEMLGKARGLMDGYNDDYDADERVVAVVIGEDVADLAEETIAYGADVALYVEDDRLTRFRHTPYTEIFCDAARGAGNPFGREDREPDAFRDYDEPRYTVFPATNNGRDLSALVQGELDSGLASDCSDLFIEDVGISNPAKTGDPGTTKTFRRVLHMKRPDFSGFEYSTILCLDKPAREFHPQGASVIPGSFELPDPDPAREGEVVEHDPPLPDEWFDVEVTEYDTLDEGVDLTGHDVVVALGRGIGEDPTRGIELGLDLVDALDDAALGLSRGVITASYSFDGHVEDYVTEERQIGESGQVVEPSVYVAAGISGAVQHKVGMDESDVIVSINTDDDADIRDFSDYYVRGDLFEVLPALTEAVESGTLDAAALADGGRRVTDGGRERSGGGRRVTDGGRPVDADDRAVRTTRDRESAADVGDPPDGEAGADGPVDDPALRDGGGAGE